MGVPLAEIPQSSIHPSSAIDKCVRDSSWKFVVRWTRFRRRNDQGVCHPRTSALVDAEQQSAGLAGVSEYCGLEYHRAGSFR